MGPKGGASQAARARDPQAFLGSYQDDVELAIDGRLADAAGTVFAASVRPLGLELNVAKSPTYFQPGGTRPFVRPPRARAQRPRW